MSKRVVTLNEDQFQAVYELVSDRVDYLVERSIDLQDSEILDDYGNLLDVHTILESSDRCSLGMISAFFTGVVVAIPTSLVMMRLLNSSLFINNSELADMNQKISVIITQLDDYREEREKLFNVSNDTK